MNLKETVKELFNVLLINEHLEVKNITKYVSEKYIQVVNGTSLNFEQFKQHIIALREKYDLCEIDFETLIEEGNKVFSKHQVMLKLKNEEIARTKVFADFTFLNGKLIYCDETTLLIKGDKEHQNLGSTLK